MLCVENAFLYFKEQTNEEKCFFKRNYFSNEDFAAVTDF